MQPRPWFGTCLLSKRFVFAIAAWELAEIPSSRNYVKRSFFWRESKRWRYLEPSLS